MPSPLSSPLTSTDPVVVALRKCVGKEAVLAGLTERLARAHDASIYRLVPRVVVRPRTVDDVRSILAICTDFQVGATFRAAGTSLSGQAVTDGVLVEIGRDWRQATVLENGAFISSDPGVTGGRLNAMLGRYRRRIGPDPASLASCTIGGIVANNASGMCCGVHDNAYQTLVSLTVVLADGYVLDTGRPGAAAALANDRPDLCEGLRTLRQKICSQPALRAAVARKFKIKNTMGYGLNALVDFAEPLDMLAHLLVGSEGTLGFISHVKLRTVEDPAHKSTGVAYFKDLTQAGAAVEGFARAGANVVEIMDRSSLAALADEISFPFELTPECSALLIEFHEDDPARLEAKTKACASSVDSSLLLAPLGFSEDPHVRAALWKLRKGLFPKIGAGRRPGTAVVIEDVCVPRDRLAAAIMDLRRLFTVHDFPEAVIFGHARDGNLHFVLCNDFADPREIARYASLMRDLTDLIVRKYDGSLKAEHGTGRNMAPFVKLEWGEELYEVMREVKRLLDPHGILNPGVLLTSDPEAHLRHLKALPAVDEAVDQCIECGFCESVCPSRDLTLTPRQRIALQREMATLRERGDRHSLAAASELVKDFGFAGVDTCAGDGLCASMCPVGIDTGSYMRKIRAREHGALALSLAGLAARHVSALTFFARLALRLLNRLGALRRILRLTPADIPLPRSAVGRKSEGVPSQGDPNRRVVYFSSCLSHVMASPRAATLGTCDVVIGTLQLCGYEVLPVSGSSSCCGQAFLSKGYNEAATTAAARLIDQVWQRSGGGEIPVVCDTSPCTSRLWALGAELRGVPRERWENLSIFDFPSFMAREVLPSRAKWPQLKRHVALHPTCSSVKHGTVQELVAVARTFASDVTVPVAAGCCGFAGDKGFRLPSLTRSATREEGAEVRQLAKVCGSEMIGYSSCQTCALGMEAATGVPYESIAHLCFDALTSVAPREPIDNKLTSN